MTMFLRFIHVEPCILVVFSYYSMVFYCGAMPYFVYSLVGHSDIFNGSLGYFQFWVIMNNPAENICMKVFVWLNGFISLEWIPRNGTSGSFGKFIFNILRICQTIFQSICTILHSHQPR